MLNDTTDDRDESTVKLPRRRVLELLGVTLVAGRASAQSDGDVAVGGGGAGHDFRHGAHSGAPETIPPQDGSSTLLWTKRGAQTAVCASGPALPQTVSANGLQWSFAGDLQTAKNNVSSQPALAIAPEGITTYAASLPAVVDGDGLRTVIAGDLTTAESERGTATPALLFGDSDGQLEVVL